MPEPKFYFTTVASRPLVFSGKTFRFLVCSSAGGRANGVYRADTEEEQSVLDGVVAGKRGVKEIGSEEYEQLKKKATPTLQSSSFGGFKPRVIQPPILPQMAVEARDGVPSAGVRPDGSQVVAENLPPAPTIGSLVKVQRIASPKPFAASEVKTKKSADRAQARIVRRSEKS